jgi:hypothetical protein
MRMPPALLATCLPLLAGCVGSTIEGASSLTASYTTTRLGGMPATNDGVYRLVSRSPEGAFTRVSLSRYYDQLVDGLVVEEWGGSPRVAEVISVVARSDGSTLEDFVLEWPSGVQARFVGYYYPDAFFYQRTFNGVNDWSAGGPVPTNIPVGVFDYSGSAVAIYQYDGVEYVELGSFDLTADFSSGLATLGAVLLFDTGEVGSTLEASAIPINSAGAFSDEAVFKVYSQGGTLLDTRLIDLHGSFHGEGATGVSGLAFGGDSPAEWTLVGFAGDQD